MAWPSSGVTPAQVGGCCAALGSWPLAGCSGGNRSFVGSPHPLIPEAREIKSAYADVLAVPRGRPQAPCPIPAANGGPAEPCAAAPPG